MEFTSGQYDGDYSPNPVVLQLAREPAHPILPRQIQQRAAPKTRKERIPLCSSLHGPGRAGTTTTLLGSHGSKYVGQVLAGRPHGVGQYYEQGFKRGQPLQLVYEGEFVRGVRQGQGTSYYSSRGEVFTGQWVDGRRTGQGKVTYADGCVYEGMFHKDVRHGVGTLYSPNGSIFVGTYEQDKRQGLGVTYWAGRCKKYVAEYVDDMATCGAMMDIDEESVEAPATQQLRDAIAAARVRAAGAAAAAAVADGSCAAPVAELPELKLIQPSKVLGKALCAVRYMRDHREPGQPGKAAALAAAIEAATGTLTANTLSLLRHAFILIAGGDDPAAHVLPHQLQELVVLAGLDPAASAVLKLLGLLHKRIEERGCKKLFQDDLLDVASFYRETPLAVMMQLQSRAAAGEAAAVEAEQQGAQLESGRSAEVWQEESALSAAASAAGSKLGQGDESESGVWGDGNGQDMLAHHIAQHTLAAPAAVECRAMRFVE